MRRTLTPVSPPRVAATTAACHGGNQYRGPGAWKRPRVSGKSSRLGTTDIITNGPLDLTAILDAESLRRDSCKKSHRKARNNRSKESNAAALKARLESLSLLLAPSHGIDRASAQSAAADEPRHAHYDRSPPACLSPCCPPQASLEAPASSVAPPWQHQNTQLQIQEHQAPVPLNHRENTGCRAVAVVVSETRRHQAPLDTSNSNNSNLVDVVEQTRQDHTGDGNDLSNTTPTQQTKTELKPELFQEWKDTTSALRVPSAATKMAVDDRCNAELLGARTTLRMLLKEQTKLREAMCRRRLEARLGTNGRKLLKNVLVSGKHSTRIGHRGRRRHEQHNARVRAGDARTRLVHAHPLLFMGEDELRKIEVDQMSLEDAEAVHLSKLEEAQRRKQDYSTYYAFSVRYGCLPAQQFESAPYPGKSYHGKVSDAVRIIQNWWWGVWPPLLRRRKTAALLLQSAVRGFLQKKKWRAIIRLRTLWGNTRIAAHAFVCWRDSVALRRRVKLFSRRFRHRCQLNCLAALTSHAQEKRQAREDVVRNRLRRAAQGIRIKIFEAWVGYTEVSLAVERMHRRSSMLPTFRAWRERASHDRLHHQMGMACAVLVSRMLRWRQRAQYVDLRKACVKIQRVAKVKIARARVMRATRDRRVIQAKDMVQAVKDERLRCLIDVEQQRCDSLQAILDQHTPTADKNAAAFLRTASGKTTLSSTLATMRDEANTKKALEGDTSPGTGRFSDDGRSTPESASILVTEAEARREVVRRLVRQEQWSIGHDFDAESPPPLRCPRADCDATFVDPYHCVRHHADVHSAVVVEGSTGIVELAVALGDPVGLAVFEQYVGVSSNGGMGGEGGAGGGGAGSPSVLGQGGVEPPRATEVEDGTTVRDVLDLWKAIEEWRGAQTSSERYRQLVLSIYDQFTPSSSSTRGGSRSSKRSHVPDTVVQALTGERDTGAHTSSATKKYKFGSHRRLLRNAHNDGGTVDQQPNEDTFAANPRALEEASWQALVCLFETIGKAFLESTPYAKYLDEVDRPTRDAVAAAAKEISDRECVEWSAEARALRQEVLRRGREADANTMAEAALARVLEGTTTGGIADSLVDDQAALLAVTIIAERGAFAKVVSAVWNEAVDEAAHQAVGERREVPPAVADALSEAAYSVARTRVMDDLIDQCVTDMTSPDGEFWPDARAMTAVVDGVAYMVRCDVMDEMIEGSVLELLGSGEAETLLVDAAARREGEQNVNFEVPRGVEVVDGRRLSNGEERTERLIGRAQGGAAGCEGDGLGVEWAGEPDPGADRGVGMREEGTVRGTANSNGGGAPSTGGNEARGTAADIWTKAEGSNAASASGERGSCGKDDDKSPRSTPVPVQSDTLPDSCTNVDVSSTISGGEIVLRERGDSAAASDGSGGRSDGKHDSSSSSIPIVDARSTLRSSVDLRAVLMVQSLVRRKAVYRQTKSLVARNYVKLYDADSGCFYWYNQVTEVSTWEKPAIVDSFFKKPVSSTTSQ